MKTKNELKTFFENGKVPQQEQFWEWLDSYWHKEEKLDSDSMVYTNSRETPAPVGKVPAGTVFNELPIREVLDFILYGKQLFTLEITTTPSSAGVSIDNGQSGNLGNTKGAYDGEVLYYHVNAQGYISKHESIRMRENMTIHVTLEPDPNAGTE